MVIKILELCYEGLYEVDIGLGTENSGEVLVAYLDLNDDSQLKLFVL